MSKLLNKTITELHQDLVNKKVTFSELYKELVDVVEQNLDSNFLITFDKDLLLAKGKELDSKPIDKDNLLYGIPYFAKDNFSTKGIQTTSGSRILEGFKPTYNSTVIELLNNAQATMAGKANLDELGMGGTGLSSGYGKVTNPIDPTRMAGGSSSGSVYAVQKGMVPFALGSDTGDSIRKPASYNGLVGYKPTYGAISRYGLMPYAPSLDHAGIISRTIEDAAIAADVLVQTDRKDFTTNEIPNKEFFKHINDFDKSKTFGYIKSIHENMPKELKAKYDELFSELTKQGIKVKPIDFRQDLLEALAPVYMMISFPEAVSTNSNLDGINFGQRVEGDSWEEIMRNTRTQKFGNVVKRRFIIGALNLKRENQHTYLLKAKKVRRLIVEEVENTFKECDFLIVPPTNDVAPLIDQAVEFDKNKSKNEWIEDILTIGNFAGIPSMTIPFVNKNGLPIGININAKAKDDRALFGAAKYLESVIDKLDKDVK